MQTQTRIVIVGGGFGGVYTLKYLHKYLCGRKDVHITLISENNYFIFTPLLHEVATGGLNDENAIESIRNELDCCISDFYLGRAESVSIEKKEIKAGDRIFKYDYLVLALGSKTNYFDIKGAKEYSFTLKTISDATKIKNRIIEKLEKASTTKDVEERKKILTFAVVGGGPTGVELSAEIHELIVDEFSAYYAKDLISCVSVLLLQKADKLMPQFSERIQEYSLKYLKKKGVKVMLNTSVSEVCEDCFYLEDRTKIDTETVVWVAGVKPVHIDIEGSEIVREKDERLCVDKYLYLENQKNIFAIGDMACFRDKENAPPLPGLAQVAKAEAKSVATNLYRLIQGKSEKVFSYKHKGVLISLGQWMAVAEIGGFFFSGRFAWWLWRTIYLSKLLSFRKKIQVAVDWTLDLFYPRDISRLE